MIPDLRLVMLFLWGGGTVFFWGLVFRKRLAANRLHHDQRSRRDLMAGGALFLVACGSALAILLVLFGPTGSGVRGLAVAIALGAFLGAGIITAGEDADARVGEL